MATCLVAIGTLVSTFWIIAANSWMQTPDGFIRTADGRFFPTSWVKALFNPAFPYRYMHTVVAAYLTTALVVGGVGAFHLLRDKTNPRARLMFSMALWMAVVIGPLQIVLGDLHGVNTYHYQPAKVAAMEGQFETEQGASSLMFGWPDAKAGQTRFALGVPKLASLYLTHNPNAVVKGLKAYPRTTWPTNIPLVFFAFRAMVGLGFLIVLLGVTGLVLRWRGKLYDSRLFQRFAVAMGPAGFLAVTAGWITTEAGRQPFTVYGLLRTADSVGPVAAPAVAASLLAFVVVYVVVFGSGMAFTVHLFGQAPGPHDPGPPADQPIRTAAVVPAPSLSGAPVRFGGPNTPAPEPRS
jgi:cytochrome d ubiquinol oxidase subunit I